jgi:hypothetical protein
MREWLLLLSPVLIVLYFLVYPDQLNALMAFAARFIS